MDAFLEDDADLSRLITSSDSVGRKRTRWPYDHERNFKFQKYEKPLVKLLVCPALVLDNATTKLDNQCWEWIIHFNIDTH